MNITPFALARREGTGDAMALVNVDMAVGDDVLDRLRKPPDVRSVKQVVL